MPAALDGAPARPSEADVREEVRRFYDSVGWKRVGPGVFQNARYEDLRPVSQTYIRLCRRRVLRHLRREGRFLLDAGSGPIQYPEYVEYSAAYRYRICLDLSARALREARERIGGHGLYVVGDIAHLPFRSAAVDGVVSLHTVHHLPAESQPRAFDEMARLLRPGATAVVVYGWGSSASIDLWTRVPIRIVSAFATAYRRVRRDPEPAPSPPPAPPVPGSQKTHTFKHGYRWLREHTRHLPGVEVLVWRSVGTRFLRAFIHERLLGRAWLALLYQCEELAPHWFGRHGQYPLIVLRKPPAGLDVPHEG
jgi:SAM-dependent methyltransferase